MAEQASKSKVHDSHCESLRLYYGISFAANETINGKSASGFDLPLQF
ncbi:hypothetical protein ACU8KH_00155 [Lachancea thermotolerans]